jgi:hypothetical protein
MVRNAKNTARADCALRPAAVQSAQEVPMTTQPKTDPAYFNFTVRLRPDDAARLDAAAAALDAAAPGMVHTRADVVRLALARLAADVAPVRHE